MAVAIAGIVAALFLTLGKMQWLNHADCLIQALTSLYRWTWFYWGQGRYGMLTAALATPVHSPLGNLLLQNGIVTFCGLMTFPLAHAYVIGWRTAPLAGLLSTGIFVLAGKDRFHQDYFINQPYAVSMCLGLLGLFVLRLRPARGLRELLRITCAAILFFLSLWVSLATVVLLVLLLAMTLFFSSDSPAAKWRRLRFALLVILPSALCNLVIIKISGYREDVGFTSPVTWPLAFCQLAWNNFELMPMAFIVSVGVIFAAGAALLKKVDAGSRREVLAACCVLAATGVVYLLVMAASTHVRDNEFSYRYGVPSLVLFVAAASLPAAWLVSFAGQRRTAYLEIGLFIALLVGISFRYGMPSYALARTTIDKRFGKYSRDIVDNKCTHIMGDYWDVWETVFHVNQVLHERGSRDVVWGITWRSKVTHDLWFPKIPSARIAVLRTAASESSWREDAHYWKLPELKLLHQTRLVSIYLPANSAAPLP